MNINFNSSQYHCKATTHAITMIMNIYLYLAVSVLISFPMIALIFGFLWWCPCQSPKTDPESLGQEVQSLPSQLEEAGLDESHDTLPYILSTSFKAEILGIGVRR